MFNKNYDIGIIVGHSQKRNGAYALEPINDYEYNYNLYIAREMADLIDDAGYRCLIVNSSKTIFDACDKIMKANCKVCIELHFNNAGKLSYGSEVLYNSRNEINKKFAQYMQDVLVSTFNRTGKGDRGIKEKLKGHAGFSNCYEIKDIPNCLLEPFFGNNKDEVKLMIEKKPEYIANVADALIGWIREEN